MRTILMTTAIAMLVASMTTGAAADSGETAVVESRKALSELWGRAEVEPATIEATASKASPRAGTEPQVHIAMPLSVWADNYAAGRVHEPADHR